MGLGAALVNKNAASKAADVQAGAARDAAQMQIDATRIATDEQRRQYDQTRNDLRSYRQIGGGSLNNLARASGIAYSGSEGEFDPQLYRSQNPDLAKAGYSDQALLEHWNKYGKAEGRASPFVGGFAGSAGGTPDMSGFFTSPDYQFTRSEGQRDIGNSFASRGGAFSGNALKALSQFNQNLASGQFGNWWNRQAGLAGVGQSATDASAAFGQQAVGNINSLNQAAAGNVGNALMQGANARASGIVAGGQAIGQGMANGANIFGFFAGGGFGGKPNQGMTVKGGNYNVPRYG